MWTECIVCGDVVEDKCDQCGILPPKAKHDHVRNLLWNIFPQSEILEKSCLPNLPNNEYTYRFVVPEYCLAIDASRNRSPSRFHDEKLAECWKAGWRYLSISSSINSETRQQVVSTINTFGVLNVPNGPALLSPKLPGDVGWDLVTSEDTVCLPGQGTDIPSDLFLDLPGHIYAVVQARSSTSKKRLLVLPGVIDSKFHGRLYSMVFNPTNEPIVVTKGSRICQLLFFRKVEMNMNLVTELKPSVRNTSGFGSTGA